MTRELAYADEQNELVKREVLEKDKALDDKNVEIARTSAELAVTGLNLANTNGRLNAATATIMKNRADLSKWSCSHSFVILKVNDENAHGAYYVIRRKRSDIRTAIR